MAQHSIGRTEMSRDDAEIIVLRARLEQAFEAKMPPAMEARYREKLKALEALRDGKQTND